MKNIQVEDFQRANLFELLDEDCLPTYIFTPDSVNFREETNLNSELYFYTFRKERPLDFEVKGIAKKVLENQHQDNLFSWGEHGPVNLFNGKAGVYGEDVKYLKIKRGEALGEVEDNGFFNFYKKHLIALPIEAASFGGSGFYFLEGNPIAGSLLAGNGLFFAGAGEITRWKRRRDAKNLMKHFQNNITLYENFEKNIEKSEVKVVNPVNAKEVYSKAINSIKKINSMDHYVDAKLNTEKINLELQESYGLFQED